MRGFDIQQGSILFLLSKKKDFSYQKRSRCKFCLNCGLVPKDFKPKKQSFEGTPV